MRLESSWTSKSLATLPFAVYARKHQLGAPVTAEFSAGGYTSAQLVILEHPETAGGGTSPSVERLSNSTSVAQN